MNSKMVAVVSLGLVAALLAWSALKQSEAQGQGGQFKPGWEYKVVAFVVENDSRDVDTQTKQINSLAAEGWEYVGLLCAGPHPHHSGVQQFIKSGGNVLFKRPKR